MIRLTYSKVLLLIWVIELQKKETLPQSTKHANFNLCSQVEEKTPPLRTLHHSPL